MNNATRTDFRLEDASAEERLKVGGSSTHAASYLAGRFRSSDQTVDDGELVKVWLAHYPVRSGSGSLIRLGPPFAIRASTVIAATRRSDPSCRRFHVAVARVAFLLLNIPRDDPQCLRRRRFPQPSATIPD